MTLSAERRRLLLVGALPTLVALVVAAHLWLLVHGNASARDDYEAGRYADARATFEGAKDLGVVSPWISPFNAGTAAYGAKQYKEAVKLFDAALHDVPDDRMCDVRVDLALTHQAMAEQAASKGDRAAQQIALRDARTSIQGTGCDDELEKDLQDQIDKASSGSNDKSEDQKLDEVEKKNREAAKVKDVELEPKNEPKQQIQW
jgi:tetratricopeptide (TPR) repeat protein